MRRDPLKFLTETAREYGDFVGLRMGPHSYYFVTNPEGIAHILEKNSRNYQKSQRTKQIKILLGDGLLGSDGEFWLRQRRLAQPAFHMQRISRQAGMMVQITEKMLERWQVPASAGSAIDVSNEMMELTLSIILQSMFSADLGNEGGAIHDAVMIGQELISARMFGAIRWPLNFPFPLHVRFRRTMKEFNRIVYRIIHERRQSGLETGDLLSMLLQVRDEETGEGMEDRHIHDELITIIVAGHETTASMLCWIWHLLSEHPEIRNQLENELASVLRGRTPQFEDLPQLTYTRMIIEEALRLYPPAWVLAREAIKEDSILGHPIQPGEVIMCSPYVNHRHPDFWKNPEAFDPMRFSPEQSAGRHRYAYFPFGGGPRQCIGNRFAMMEAQLILATIAQRYRLQLAPNSRPEPLAAVTLKHRDGLHMFPEQLSKQP